MSDTVLLPEIFDCDDQVTHRKIQIKLAELG
jgi:hypothetical protein